MEKYSIKKPAPRNLNFKGINSFGALGEPQPASYGRIKGFYTGGVINSKDHLNEAVAQFKAAKEKLNNNITRLQYRAVAEGRILRENREVFRPILEAAVPLDPGHLGEEPFFVYLSYNSELRQPHQDDLMVVNQNIKINKTTARKSINQLLEGIFGTGFSAEIFSREAKQNKIDELSDLYKRFNWLKDDVRKILNNPNIIVGVVRDNNLIVSVGMAEIVLIPLGDKYFRVAEITEAATLESYSNRKLYTGISTLLLLELKRLSMLNKIYSGELDLVFGESNLFSPQMLAIAAQQGREFSTEACLELGFTDTGIVWQQVPIYGTVNCISGLNDLVVTSVRRSHLYAME